MYFIETTDILQTQNIEICTFYVCTTNEHTSGINWNHPLAVYFASFIANRSNWRVKGEIDYVRWKKSSNAQGRWIQVRSAK